MIYMTQIQLKTALDDIPTSENINIALCSVPAYQVNGIDTYERRRAAEAIALFYRRRASENWEKDRRSYSKKKKTRHYADVARNWLKKAQAIERIILKWDMEEKPDEHYQAVI